jgi:UDP-3-O-[3-hydroxymyristoyl] N-acetylglucosamine deacetylase
LDEIVRFQNTINKETYITGTGLHSGREINIILKPAPRDTGVVFIRSDKGNVEIKASVASVSDTSFATTLAKNGVRVGTVEHLLSAFAGMNIDNVYVELDGPEIPIMDGSALPFVSSLLETGIAKQAKRVSCLRILEPVVVIEGNCQIAISPYEGTRITHRVSYTHPAFGDQRMGIDITDTNYINELAPARTFGFLRDVEMLRARGLVRGGSLENAIVLGEKDVINKGKLRFRDEFVRHKILDVIGDISLLGLPVYGHIMANKSGHTLSIKLLKKILLSRSSWDIISEVPVTSPALGLTA